MSRNRAFVLPCLKRDEKIRIIRFYVWYRRGFSLKQLSYSNEYIKDNIGKESNKQVRRPEYDIEGFGLIRYMGADA